jgi:hypothetical protein
MSDLRSGDRYIVSVPIQGSFGTATVAVLNLSDQGACIEHAQPLRLAAPGRLAFRFGEVAVGASGIVVWSHLSKTPNNQGKYLYRSGLRIEEEVGSFTQSVQALINQRVLLRDLDSLERKRRRELERETAQKNRPIIKVIPQEEVPPDQALLIQHARERLRLNPDEARKWYQRAKYAGAEEIPTDLIRYREDVLAVWEYLERSVPLAHIVRVFERKG